METLTPRRWTLHEPHADAAALAADLDVSPILAQVLLNRGMSDAAAGRAFLKPTLKLLHDPGTIPNLTYAAKRIAASIKANEKIVIYGDYDVDGITATSILWHAIRTLGGEVDYYIPHRIDEGYGLHGEAISQICHGGAKLIVTVDCGVTATAAAKVAEACGIDLIITDHHEFDCDNLPCCYTVVHPRLEERAHLSEPAGREEGDAPDRAAHEAYANPHLCGAGVAFKLAWAIGTAVSGAVKVSESFRAFLLEATALAALGTIADVVPLVGENRVLAHFGLGGLKASKLVGIKALIEAAGLTGQELDSYHVGFLLGPRLNAAGRMGHARLAVEMLTTATAERAMEIADYLETQNRTRQAMEREILAAAIEQAEANGASRPEVKAIVVGDAGWHPGVIGIVASRLVDRYYKPAIVIALRGDEADGEAKQPLGQGSGRSIPGFHLATALRECTQYLVGHGGHEMAAGLKIEPARFEEFRQAFLDYAARTLSPDEMVRDLRLDVSAELSQLTQSLVQDLKRLGPFGMGNSRPVLCLPTVELAAPPRRVGKTGDHLQMYVRQGQTSMKCIAFGAGDRCDELKPGMALRLAAEPQLNEFNGRTSVELQVRDLAIEG